MRVSVILIALFLLLPAPVRAGDIILPEGQQIYLALGALGSFASDMPLHSNNAVGFGWSARAGWRDGRFGLFTAFVVGRWLAADYGLSVQNGAFTAGVGAELLLFSGRARIGIGAGTATLLYDATFHEAGSTGFYVDVNPASARWPIRDWLVIEFTPLTATILVPGMGNPLLRRLEYRTVLTLEVIL